MEEDDLDESYQIKVANAAENVLNDAKIVETLESTFGPLNLIFKKIFS